MDGYRLSELLAEKLNIELPPVGVAFVDECPDDVPELVRESPSFCTLWRWGEERTFYASGEQHVGCGIGGVVSGFLSPDGIMDDLTALLAEMCEAGPGGSDEIEQTAKLQHDSAGVIYGPLWNIPVAPDLVLMWATLPQMGVLQEITGTIMWRDNPQGAVFTRPACGVLALAAAHGKPAMSLGCVGMRLYTKVPPQYFLMAVPGSTLDDLLDGLEAKDDAPERLAFYQDRLGAARPSH